MLNRVMQSLILVLGMAAFVYAEAPQLINYQAVLTDNVGDLVADGSYSVVFTIYDAPVAGTSVWTEIQNVNTVNGLFAILLGTINPVLDTVFNGTTRYLGIAVASDPEISPRTALVSVPYAFRVATVDGASGGNISSKVSIGPGHTLTGDDAGIGGGHTNTASGQESYIGGGHGNNASEHDATVSGGFGNTANAVASTVGGGNSNTAGGLNSSVAGGESNNATGNWSTVGGGGGNTAGNDYATIGGGGNNTVSDTYSTIAGGILNSVSGKYSAILGGFGDTIQSTADYSYLFGIKSVLTQDSTFMVDMPHIRFGDEATGFEFPPIDGTSGQVMSTDGSGQLSWVVPGGGGEANGWVDDGTVVRLDNSNDSVGIGTATPDAPVHISKSSNTSTPSFGFHTEFSNTGTGGGIAANIVYNHGNTSGLSAGMTVSSTANSPDTAYGIGATASNDGAGPAKGGFFASTGSGAGHKYGIEALAENNASSDSRGVYGIASNSGAGSSIGGYFHAKTGGTGTKWGVIAVADGNTTSQTTGVRGIAWNYGTGGSKAATFDATQGPGINKGVEAAVTTIGSSDAYLYTGSASSEAGNIYGFNGTFSSNSGDVYGMIIDAASTTGSVRGATISVTSAGSAFAFGVNSSVLHSGTGETIAGRFTIFDGGSGQKSAVSGTATGAHSAPVYGVRGAAYNNGSGNAYGVRGGTFAGGTGSQYGVYGSEESGGGGAAVYASGDQIASGTKSAIMVTSQGERLMYAVEATEVWFEDIGRAQLNNGHTHIELDALFLETVVISLNNPMQVFVQLNGDCNGTYVTTDATGFDVNELQNGTSNVTFTYRVMAKRKGYADERMRKTDAGKYDINLYPERKAEIEAYWKDHGDQDKQRANSIE